MLRNLANQLTAEALIARDEHVVVGVSGGPDSMALLHLLLDLNRLEGWSLRLHVAHLNHGLRGEEGERDAAFVEAAADSLELPSTVERIDVSELSRQSGQSIEEAARGARYAFFERVAEHIGAGVVAVAHHDDDNAETILHRILRGTGLRGLAGIARSRPIRPGSTIRLVRPLLRMRKQALLNYLNDQGVAWREDRTNQSREFMRNRLRNVVLPLIEEQVNPQVREALTRLGEQAAWLNDYLRETVQRTFETLIITRNDDRLELNVEAMVRKSRIVQTELVRLGYLSFGLGEQELSFANIVAVLDLAADPASGKRVQLPGGLEVVKSYHKLVFMRPTDETERIPVGPEVAVHVPGRTRLPHRNMEIECEVFDLAPRQWETLRPVEAGSSAGGGGGKWEEYISFDAVHLPLTVRSRRPGDRFCPLGSPGTRKLSDFLSDLKIEPEERNRVAILCDRAGPIWIVGFRIDDRVKLTPQTRKGLRLCARPMM